MPELELLREDHEVAVLAFETENRAWFAATITDRGDEFFARYAEKHAARLAEQRRREAAYYVLVDDAGAVLGRFNLILRADGVAELGYRVAERVAGQGVATGNVADLCRLAASRHGITTLRAATSDANLASRRVLLANGFTEVGPADPGDVGGKRGTWFERALVSIR